MTLENTSNISSCNGKNNTLSKRSQCPMGLTYCTIVWDTYSDTVTLNLMLFNQAHSCIHIKNGCITVCINM